MAASKTHLQQASLISLDVSLVDILHKGQEHGDHRCGDHVSTAGSEMVAIPASCDIRDLLASRFSVAFDAGLVLFGTCCRSLSVRG
jgi:hypothetical protein